ncbi:MAG: hypothetical protein HUJ58_09735 [Erysipelotrichaceae bacterium]|nr:hypothetical protein [Erysipelotrichaceae bacterium]
MKIYCDHCKKEITQIVGARLNKYEGGKVNCGHCHKLNKRYISSFDLHLIACGNMAIYGVFLMVMLLGLMLNPSANFWFMSLLTGIVMVGSIFGITKWPEYVYLKAPFKQAWANVTIKEDAAAAQSHARKMFFGFVGLVVASGIVAALFSYVWMVVAILSYIAYNVLSLRTIYQQEKEYYEKTFGK